MKTLVVASMLLSTVILHASSSAQQAVSSGWIPVSFHSTGILEDKTVSVPAPLITKEALQSGAVIVYLNTGTMEDPAIAQLPTHRIRRSSFQPYTFLEIKNSKLLGDIVSGGKQETVFLQRIQTVNLALSIGQIVLQYDGPTSEETYYVRYVIIPAVGPPSPARFMTEPVSPSATPEVPRSVVRPTDRMAFSGRIRSAATNKLLGPLGSGTDLDPVAQFAEGDQRARVWYFEPLSGSDDGLYLIHVDGAEGKCLDVRSSSMDDAAPVTVYQCSGTDNQKWRIVRTEGSSAVLLQARHSGKVLDVPGSSGEAGLQITQSTQHGGPNQQWYIQILR